MVMNEQIQNLKDKIWTEEYWTKPNTDKLLPAQLNRFAELIVRECAEIGDGYDNETKYNQGLIDIDIQTAGDEIRKHFGVER
jgi:hypothetical protein